MEAITPIVAAQPSMSGIGRKVLPLATIREGMAMMMRARDCMEKAVEMDAKASACTDAPATALYEELAKQWRALHDQALWQDAVKCR